MSVTTATARANDTPSIAARIVDAARHAAHLTQEAGSITASTEEAVQHAADAVRRTARSVRREIEKMEDDSTHYVRRHPLKTIGIAAGIGMVVGVATGWMAGWLCSAKSSERA
ncbi:MAG TPA: hypothetical protein VFA27_12420 [Vicinamibacterales bacterium]|nr:hypothetical protein [Vicinamibacterales bacterium]